jgi:glycosidase
MTELAKVRQRIDQRCYRRCARCWLAAVGAAVVAALVAQGPRAAAEDTSAPAILQWFEATYDTMERRSADMFLAGYGAVWTPPPGRADISNYSVGYDVYDRFDLGGPGDATLYGTETGLKQLANVLHRFNGRLHIDAVLNHNAYSENNYVNPQFTTFLQAGGYPGFALQNPDGGTDPAGVPGTFGDFHNPAFGSDYLNGQLAELLDIDHGTNHQLIRQPVAAGNSQNIPAGATAWVGRLANVPDAANARFYPDTNLPGVTYFDPATSQNVTVYPYNTANPLAGDAVAENATGLLRRYLQWMVQEIGVDAFRLDAAKHMEHYALQQFDAAVYRSNPRLRLDGSVEHVFMYGEVVPGDGQAPGQSVQDFLYGYIRKDINPAQPNTIGGNRDVLDFALRQTLNDNLSSNGLQNDWRNLVNSGMDVRDDGYHNGSAGVTFVSNHDGGGAQMTNVAHAYLLTQPGNAIVYYNADQFDDPNRLFPVAGRGDALGNYGNTITELVNIRNTHGRGDYRERWIEKDYFAMERSGNLLVLLDNRNDSGASTYKTMDIDLPVNTRLVELTGNAAANGLDQVITVQNVGGASKVNVRFLHNGGQDKGYLIYGVQIPQSTAGLTITNSSSTLAGGPIDSGNTITNATTRLANLPVVAANQINIRLDTQAVTLPGGYRDLDADGDNAVLRVNSGTDTNGNGHIDYTTPGSVVYGFEEFSPGEKSPGYGSPSGNGWYQKSIDATNLPEGYNFVTVRAFRHRSDGGPAVFNDFKQVVYLDRVAPPAAVVSFAPFASAPGNPNNRDLILRSVDGTANNMHVLLDQPANLTNSQILAMASGSNQASYYDRDSFVRGYNGVSSGNHVATVITYEPTGNYNIQRFAGLLTQTNLGLGFGDMNATNTYTTTDIRCSGACSNNSVEDVLYSQNSKFRAAFDVNGDGLGDNRDLFALSDELVARRAGQTVLNSYTDLLLHRGDLNASNATDAADIAALYGNFGNLSWLMDLNVDGAVNTTDVQTMVTQVFRTVAGDFNVDGRVDGADYVLWRNSGSVAGGALYTQGDADFDGDVDGVDLAAWRSQFGFVRQPLSPGAGSGTLAAAVPEPAALTMWLLAGSAFVVVRRHWRAGRLSQLVFGIV